MRTHYRNGDEITLKTGCDGCSPSIVNGVLCHEQGCPDAWKDIELECYWCGTEYYPDQKPGHLKTCSPDCYSAYMGFDTDNYDEEDYYADDDE